MALSSKDVVDPIRIMTARAEQVRAESIKAVDRCIAGAQSANQEYHRYAIAGAGGGIAILASQFADLAPAAQATSVVAVLFFIYSLRCSLLTYRAMWLDRSAEAREWAAWGNEAVKAAFAVEDGQPATLILPDPPRPLREGYERWSPLAIGSLTGGGVTSVITLALALEPTLPLWLTNLPHRLAHIFGWA
jgi:hypothetical protein